MRLNSVLIAGAGQLGTRYLQGLAKSSTPLNIWVSDPSEKSLALANYRWKEAGGAISKHSLHLVNSMVALPPKVDLAIVSTTADVRADVVEAVAACSVVSFWVLEKVLAQSQKDLDRLIHATSGSDAVWVNIPRRIMKWYQALAEKILEQNPTEVRIYGGKWGLACNSVHLLDLGAYLLNESLLAVDASCLDANWHESKRAGFFEVNGILRAQFSGGKSVTLKCEETDANMAIEVNTNEGLWQINEFKGEAITPDGKSLVGRLENQSEMTGSLVQTILKTGGCELPSLDQAVVLHRPFLDALIAHWNQSQNIEGSKVPIT